MAVVQFDRIAIVGVGLLGGSIGLAAKQKHLCAEVVGFGRVNSSLEEAQRMGAIDRWSLNLRESVAGADLIILCTPVRHILSILPEVCEAAKAGAIITDVGSTKNTIVCRGEELARRGAKVFVGSHPMAGSEKTGVRHARADLFHNSTCFVTKTAQTDLRAFGAVCTFWRALEARVVLVRPDRHDKLVSLVSHLPHLVAVALVQTVASFNEDKNLIKGIIGNGFRDSTRIAAGHAQMWEEICSENHGEIQGARETFENALSELMRSCCGNAGEMSALLDTARIYREFLNNR